MNCSKIRTEDANNQNPKYQTIHLILTNIAEIYIVENIIKQTIEYIIAKGNIHDSYGIGEKALL